jgi:hypothetical protein
MAQQRPATSFDLSKFSTSTKILVGAGAVGIINAIIPWWGANKICVLGNCVNLPGHASALGGAASWAGVLMFILLLGLVAWEVMLALGTLRNVNLPLPASRITLILAGATVFFGLLKFLLALGGVFIGAFIGLIVLLAIAYGAYMRYQEPESAAGPPPPATGPPPPAAGGGGFTT